jgi:sortase B
MAGKIKKLLNRVITLALVVVLVVSLYKIGNSLWGYYIGGKSSSEAEQVANLPDLSAITREPDVAEPEPGEEIDEADATDPYIEALESIDLAALQEENSDVLGWIFIPDTKVNYPVLQSSDNEYYLDHTWQKTSSATGSIFLDYQSSGDMSDFNTLIYGHRMANGSMFRTLANYNTQSYWEEHPSVYVVDAAGCRRYDVFAAYEVSVVGISYEISFADDAAKQDFINQCLARSCITTGVQPTVDDRIITLSTCTGRGYSTRWVVQAVYHEAEAETETEAEAG